MPPISAIMPIIGVSLFASSFFLMSEKAPVFQASFERASVMDIPKTELPNIAEFPESRSAIVSELKARNDEMRKCLERKRCVFLMVYSESLGGRLKTIDEGTDPLGYLERKYGREAYDFVSRNRDLLELKLDERFTAWLLRKTDGKILSADNGFSREEIPETYEEFVINEALPELLGNLRDVESLKSKAVCEFGIRYLLSDVRLLTVRSK